MRLAPVALATVALLGLAAVAQASAGTVSAGTVAGVGDFTARLAAATWAAPPPVRPLELATSHLHIVVVDDRVENRVAHPLNASKDLYGDHRPARTERDFADATVRIRSAGDPDALLVLRAPAADALLPEGFRVEAAAAQRLDESHYARNRVGVPESSRYTVEQPAALRVHHQGASLTLLGEARGYAWGAVIEVTSAGETWTFRTGAWDDPAPAGASHMAYAWLDLRDLAGPLAAADARLWSSGLEVAGAGILELRDPAGQAAAAAQQLRLGEEPVALGLGQGRVQVAVAPQSTSLSPAAAAIASPLGWLGLTLLVAAVPAAGMAPSAYGRFLQRRGRIDALLAGRARRAEAYAAIAARLDVAGHARLARLMAARAVANQPHVAGHRIELAIHLQRLDRLREAVREHEAAHALMAAPSDRNEIALNAFHAALACARLHRDGAAAWWLGTALRHDPGLEADLGDHPVLARLRRHPQVRMLVP